MNDPVAVTVVVPTLGRGDSVVRLLRALCEQTLPPAAFEVTVCVDGDDLGTRQMIAAFEAPYRLEAIGQPQGGRASACNAAISTRAGEIIVILDDDMQPTHRCLEAHRRAHPTGSRRCVVGAVPIATSPSDPPLTGYIARKFEAHLNRLERGGHDFGIRDFYSGNASIRRDVLLETGPFDESFRSYGNEDLELAFRLRKSGVSIEFSPDAVAVQSYSKRFDALAGDTMAKGRTAVQFAAMHPEVLPELQFAAPDVDSLRWRMARGGLLELTSLVGVLPATLTRLTAVVERIGFRRLDTLYRFLLEYFYWLGVRSAQTEASTPTGRD